MLCLAAGMVAAAFIMSRKGAVVEARETQTQVVAQFDTVAVPVPVDMVPAGAKVSEIKLHMVSFPKHQLPQGALVSLAGYLDAVTTSPLPANIPLFKENLNATALSKNPVIERIPAGMRAMTIRVDATSAVEGWAGSGAVVDVLLVEKDKTSVIAENVKILSAERTVSPVEGAASPNVPSTVTLLVTQEQCLAINTAIPLGRIAFALRGGKDSENWSSTTFTAENLKGGATISDSKRGTIKGVIAVKGEKSFALADGKWIKTEVVPEGFFVEKEK